jgi:hypothetical protein
MVIMKIDEQKMAIEAEMADAIRSRSAGNEGRARVCARRAAGLATAVYYEKCMHVPAGKSAYDLIKWIGNRDELDLSVRAAAQRLIQKVTPDHTLPHQQDPLTDARLLISSILQD